MIENFTSLSSIKSEMSVAEVNKCNDASKQKHPRIISLTLLLKRIVSQFITIGFIVHLGVLFESHSESVT